MIRIKKIWSLLLVCSFAICPEIALPQNQSFLRSSGISIVDGNNNEILLRGMGLGGWMLQEGYMLETADFAGTQHEIRARIEEVAGLEGMESFYEAWLSNHVTKKDIDSLAKWGFNSVRPALHYNLFTLPIDEEPVGGRQTWLDKGFVLLDSLISWCAVNEMYVILDLHAAPGGQGRDNNISDRDPNKLSLWESSANRTKTIELWKKLAERYHNNPWVGGYDILNEPNWDFENSGNQNGCNCRQNAPILELYQKIITAIRSVDSNHLIFIEGNCWAGNFNGLLSLTSYDKNLALSFHRYWNSNSIESIQEKLNLRDTYQVPLWMGESGENSNHWFAEAIQLLEENHIGWSWWPEKKINSIVGPMTVVKTPDYETLLRYWRSGGTKPEPSFARATLMQIAENLKIENCQVHPDVMDAMFRQPHTNDVKPFHEHPIPGTIFASDFDLGKNGFAYLDQDYENSGGPGSSQWNQGWLYRNDGPDILNSNDSTQYSNGYAIGFIEKGEWLNYTFLCDSGGYYDIGLRTAAIQNSGALHLLIDGTNVSGTIAPPHTGSNLRYQQITIPQVKIGKGEHRLTIYFDEGGFNLGCFIFSGPVAENQVAFGLRSAATDPTGKQVIVSFSGPVVEFPKDAAGFSLSDGTHLFYPDSASYESDNPPSIRLWFSEIFLDNQNLTLSYTGGELTGPEGEILQPFTNIRVINIIIPRLEIPGRIEAEDYAVNQGFGFENCQDSGGGKNAGWSDAGDYLEYPVIIKDAGTYQVDYRFSCYSGNAKASLSLIGNEIIHLQDITFPATGGWQNWQSLSEEAELASGLYTLRFTAKSSGFNLNRIDLTWLHDKETPGNNDVTMTVFPNPAHSFVQVEVVNPAKKTGSLQVTDMRGRVLLKTLTHPVTNATYTLDTTLCQPGIYILSLHQQSIPQVRTLLSIL